MFRFEQLKRASFAPAFLCLALLGQACAGGQNEYVGNAAKGFWSEQNAKISPNEAFRKAQPYLAATWEARCEQVRNHDEYCEEMPLDHMVRKGKFYYLTRTSYPYEDFLEYTNFAVRVNVDTGEVIPLAEN